METNPLKDGALTENSSGIGTVTREMIRERAVDLAVINGRAPHETSKSDWEQAKQELTGCFDTGSNQAVLDAALETDRWDPVHGLTGDKVSVASGEDEDDEGRSDDERLVDEGMAGAEEEQTLQASQEAAKEDE